MWSLNAKKTTKRNIINITVVRVGKKNDDTNIIYWNVCPFYLQTVIFVQDSKIFLHFAKVVRLCCWCRTDRTVGILCRCVWILWKKTLNTSPRNVTSSSLFAFNFTSICFVEQLWYINFLLPEHTRKGWSFSIVYYILFFSLFSLFLASLLWLSFSFSMPTLIVQCHFFYLLFAFWLYFFFGLNRCIYNG